MEDSDVHEGAEPGPQKVAARTMAAEVAAHQARRWDGAVEAVIEGRLPLAAHYQPIVDLHRGTIVGYEALARFGAPPTASPDLWFREAGRRGLGPALEARALGVALDDRDRLPVNCFLSVNVSPLLLDSEPIRLVLGGRDLSGVVLELTEHDPIEDYDAIAVALEPLRAAGAKVAVDDAGAGYAGLNHILILRPDIMKLDRSLIEGLHLDEAKRALVEMVGTFADRIDSWLLAEGIERFEELDALVRLEVPLAQGFLLSRPAPSFAALDPALADRIRQRSTENRRWRDAVGAVAEWVPTVADTDLAHAFERFDALPEATWLVVLGHHRRPIGLVDRLLARTGAQMPLMTVGVLESSAAVLHRAMLRADGNRFEPVAVCDAAGQLLGLASIDRLVSQVLDQPGPRA
ncbi:hypothetical protein BH24ACT3_BH24ACT3_01290 [soil metagenome]